MVGLLSIAFSYWDSASAQKDTTYLDFGGAFRLNFFYKNWEGEVDNRNKGGEIKFDTWRINVKGQIEGVKINTEYRFYAGYSFLKHGWLSYDFSRNTHLEAGLTKVPFGLLPYASHNWFEMIPYYVGLEDDYDLGLKLIHQTGPLDFRAAFFKNAESSFTGSSENSSRFSYDVVGENEEVNQGNIRVAYQLNQWEIGASAQYSQLYNKSTQEMGWHGAGAIHAEGQLNRWNIKAEAIHYEYSPDKATGSDDFILMGAYDAPYQVAKKGQMYVGGISYQLPLSWGPLESLTFYNDFTFFDKTVSGYTNSKMNVAGMMVEAGPIYAYFDVASGNNHPWIGPAWSEALSRGTSVDASAREPAPEWATRFNMNIGYYF